MADARILLDGTRLPLCALGVVTQSAHAGRRLIEASPDLDPQMQAMPACIPVPRADYQSRAADLDSNLIRPSCATRSMCRLQISGLLNRPAHRNDERDAYAKKTGPQDRGPVVQYAVVGNGNISKGELPTLVAGLGGRPRAASATVNLMPAG
jgi:hypothetical protein